MRLTSHALQGRRWGGFPKYGVPTIMENQMEKKMENEMETGIYRGSKVGWAHLGSNLKGFFPGKVMSGPIGGSSFQEWPF